MCPLFPLDNSQILLTETQTMSSLSIPNADPYLFNKWMTFHIQQIT